LNAKCTILVVIGYTHCKLKIKWRVIEGNSQSGTDLCICTVDFGNMHLYIGTKCHILCHCVFGMFGGV